MDYIVRRYQRTGQKKKIKSRAGKPKVTTRAEGNFIRPVE